MDRFAKGANVCSAVRSTEGTEKGVKGGEEKKIAQLLGITCLIAHTGTSCLTVHTGTPCPMAHAGTTCLAAYAPFLPSSPYPPPKARRPDEPQRNQCRGRPKAWVVGSGAEKKVGHVSCYLDGQSENKGVVGGIKG